MKKVVVRQYMTGKEFFNGKAGCVYIWGVPIEWVDYDNDVLTITMSTDAEVDVTQQVNGKLDIRLAHND